MTRGALLPSFFAARLPCRLLEKQKKQKSRASPELLRRLAQVVWYQRWIRMLSVAAQTALVETLLRPSSPRLTELDGDTPDLSGGLGVDGRAPRSAGVRRAFRVTGAARTADGARSGR